MTSRDVYFFGNACAFSSRKAVSVPTSVIGGLGAPWRPANLFDFGRERSTTRIGGQQLHLHESPTKDKQKEQEKRLKEGVKRERE